MNGSAEIAYVQSISYLNNTPVIYASPDAQYPPFVAIVTTSDRLYAISASTLYAFDIISAKLIFSSPVFKDLAVNESELSLTHLRALGYKSILVVGTVRGKPTAFVEYNTIGNFISYKECAPDVRVIATTAAELDGFYYIGSYVAT